ncbi:hypothetical protein GIB67_015995 [Kingdonia uniflora]|uniref:Small nuclear ribonucleoprotein G n=1 Tax=Kingdonia uniflora TaxID=39325 RepID=A0A7J7L1T3_9MAGN|nr:hypothetical protein GIB67_015995 [Kingdonia uniflora]
MMRVGDGDCGEKEVHGQAASDLKHRKALFSLPDSMSMTVHFYTVKLNANRVVVGTLRGFDQFMNLVIDNTVETNGNEKNEIGMVVIRGNSVVMIEALEPVQRAQ